ncbi:MAG: hypothetical protein U1F76_11880 [Candidatus Competibacteraceae bacterium]
MEVKCKCDCCGQTLEKANLDDKESCPNCGATARFFTHVHVEETKIFESTHSRVKDPNLPSKRKLRLDLINGYEWSVALEKYVKKIREINRMDNHYHERIEDPDSGEVIHEKTEPLNEHIGHGYAKFKS